MIRTARIILLLSISYLCNKTKNLESSLFFVQFKLMHYGI
jgi:hypothetical protein